MIILLVALCWANGIYWWVRIWIDTPRWKRRQQWSKDYEDTLRDIERRLDAAMIDDDDAQVRRIIQEFEDVQKFFEAVA